MEYLKGLILEDASKSELLLNEEELLRVVDAILRRIDIIPDFNLTFEEHMASEEYCFYVWLYSR